MHITANLSERRALLLNADFSPLSYFPLSLLGWQQAVKAVFLERVITVAEYDEAVRSPSLTLKLPSVIALKRYVPLRKNPPFTRFNLFLRDAFSCQYCQKTFPVETLTFDHVTPRSKGGTTCWENVVAACQSCNHAKGHRTLRQAGFKLAYPPRRPSHWELREAGRAFPPHFLHESWVDYLYWDSELEQAPQKGRN